VGNLTETDTSDYWSYVALW